MLTSAFKHERNPFWIGVLKRCLFEIRVLKRRLFENKHGRNSVLL